MSPAAVYGRKMKLRTRSEWNVISFWFSSGTHGASAITSLSQTLHSGAAASGVTASSARSMHASVFAST